MPNDPISMQMSQDIGELKADMKNALNLLKDVKDSQSSLEARVASLESFKYYLFGIAAAISVIFSFAKDFFTHKS